MAYRYAIYFCPENTALARFGARVLGVDVHRAAAPVDQFDLNALSRQEFATLTEKARGYGFHATLKAPFRLAQGQTENALIAAFQAFCASAEAATLPQTSVQNLHGFLAIMPAYQPESLQVLERDIVTYFEAFRAPLNEEERARRQPDRLSERQCAYLDQLGYPFVFEEFRFHMTLSARLTSSLSGMALHAELQDLYERLVAQPDQAIDGLTLAIQDHPNAPFHALTSCKLAP